MCSLVRIDLNGHKLDISLLSKCSADYDSYSYESWPVQGIEWFNNCEVSMHILRGVCDPFRINFMEVTVADKNFAFAEFNSYPT